MIIEDNNIYPHLAKFQMREQAKCEKLKTYMKNMNEFGRIGKMDIMLLSEEREEEELWKMEMNVQRHGGENE